MIVPTFNRAAYLERSLASWCHQDYRNYELIVIDDGGSDNTAAVVRGYEPVLPVRLQQISRSGRSGARNHGIRASNGELLLFCDDDRVVPPDFVREHVRCHGDSNTRKAVLGWQFGAFVELRPNQEPPPEVASWLAAEGSDDKMTSDTEALELITAAQLRENPRLVEALKYPEPMFDQHALPLIATYGDRLRGCPLAWCCGTSGNLSLRKEFLEQIGLFDQTFQGWGFEDTELLYRVVHCGGSIHVTRSACNYHQNHRRNRFVEHANWRGNALLFLEKYPTLQVGLMILCALRNTPLLVACEVLTEAESTASTALVRAYTQLVLDTVRIECARFRGHTAGT